jgi:MFS family permease
MKKPFVFDLAMERTFYSLRNRNFKLFFIGQMISNSGNWLTNVALILLVLKLTGSGLAVGLLTAFEFGPLLLVSPWAGSIADRYDKRHLLIVTQSLEMLQSIGLAILAFMPNPSIYGFYALALFGGIFLALDNPIRRSFVSEMVPKKDIPNAVVLYNIIVNASRAFGPVLAGLFIVTLGYGWAFTIDAISYLAVLVCLQMMRPKELFTFTTKNKGKVSEGFRYVFSQPFLWISFMMFIAIGMMSYNFNVTLPLFVTDSLHSTDAIFTIIYSIFSIGAVFSALLVANKNLVRMPHINIGAALLGATMLLLAFMPGVVTASVVVFLVGMASMLYMTATTAIIQVEGKREMHGRLLAFQAMILGGTRLAGGPLLGWMADNIGSRAPIMIGGLVCLLSATFGYIAFSHFSKKLVKKLPS